MELSPDHQQSSTAFAFACEQCRSGKRKCDGTKPQCSLCRRLSKECVYAIKPRQRKRKYWDEEYVHGLEQQVRTLLQVVERHQKSDADQPNPQTLPRSLPPALPDLQVPQPQNDSHPSTSSPPEASFEDRSQAAMEELSVMMWRTNLGDGVTITQDDHHAEPFSFRIAADTTTEAQLDMHNMMPPARILEYAQDRALLDTLAAAFLDNINREHQFTQYRSTDFLDDYPFQTPDATLLHTAILAVGAAFLGARDPAVARIGEDFARYAERIVFDCVRASPSPAVLQALCMLSFRSLSLGRDHMGWMFISMAGGLCVHLRLHVLAVDEGASCLRPQETDETAIRTFWMFYFVDKSAVTILGRNCALPWRRVNVPELESVLCPDTADLADLSFAWQCRLWYAHDAAIDQICSRSFESLPRPQQARLLVSTLDQLSSFFHSRPRQLDMDPDASKPVILFHLQYHMAILIILSPFLRIAHPDPAQPADAADVENSILLVLRSTTASASQSIRLCRAYRDRYTFAAAHPILAHHLLSSALVHLMNATSTSAALRRQSTHWLRVAMELLDQLRVVWPTRAAKSITVVRVLAQKWGVTGSLPVRFSGPVEPEDMTAGDSEQRGDRNVEYVHKQTWVAGLPEDILAEHQNILFHEAPFGYYDPTMGSDLHESITEMQNFADM